MRDDFLNVRGTQERIVAGGFKTQAAPIRAGLPGVGVQLPQPPTSSKKYVVPSRPVACLSLNHLRGWLRHEPKQSPEHSQAEAPPVLLDNHTKCSSCVLSEHKGSFPRQCAEPDPRTQQPYGASASYHLHPCPEGQSQVPAGTTKPSKLAPEPTTKDHNSASGAPQHPCRCLGKRRRSPE